MKESKKSAFSHDYPAAPGVTSGGGKGGTPWVHSYPTGGMGTVASTGHTGGPTAFEHPYPSARQPGHPRNIKGTKRPPLTSRLKKRSKGVAPSAGKRK